jgi:hypothetical protein
MRGIPRTTLISRIQPIVAASTRIGARGCRRRSDPLHRVGWERQATGEGLIVRKIRFTIGGLMAVVLVLAIGFAALLNPNATWAGVSWFLAYSALGLAILGAVLGRGAERAWWLGFAVFEGGYLMLASSRWIWLVRPLPTLRLLEWLRLKIGAATEPTTSQVRLEDVMFAQIVHCLWALLAAILGGLLARAFFESTPVRCQGPEPVARGTDRLLGRSWFRTAVHGLVGLILCGTAVAIWSTSEAGLWAGGMYLLTCGLFGIAILAALFGRGRCREACIGAALFGVGYLCMALPYSRIPHYEEPRIDFVTDQFLNALRPLVSPRSRGFVSNARNLEALERPISMRFLDEIPLGDLLKYIAMATSTPDYPGIPIYVDPLGLQEAERSLQSIVSIDLQGVPLKTTLRLCLKQLGLAYFVEDGCPQITSEDSADSIMRQKEDPFLVVGHCLLALLAAGLGGVLAPLVSAASRDRTGRPADENAPAPVRAPEAQAGLSAGMK